MDQHSDSLEHSEPAEVPAGPQHLGF